MNSASRDVEWPDLLPHQYEFAFNLARYPALWGSWGSAKTWALAFRCILLSITTDAFGDFTGNVGVLGRQVAKDLRDTTLRDFEDLIPKKWITTFNKQEGLMELIGGSQINLVHFDNFTIGANLGWAAIDQMEEVSKDTFEKLQGRIRRTRLRGEPGPDGKARTLHYRTLFGVGNTNGMASWQYERWEYNRQKFLAGEPYDPDFWTLPPLTVFDNPYLPEDYIQSLQENLPPKKWRVYALGSWEALEGQIIEDWDEIYCTNNSDVVPPTSTRKYVFVDHGNASGVKYAGFFALYHDMSGLIYDEVYGDGLQQEEFCRQVRSKLELHEKEMADAEGRRSFGMEQITLWPCDPSMMRKTEDNSSLNIIQSYAQHASRLKFSMPLYAAPAGSGSVDAGNDKINWLFKNCRPERDGLPHVKVNPRCTHMRKSTASYVYDPKTNKPKEHQDDHPVDAFRYLANVVYVGDFAEQYAGDEELSTVEQVMRDLEHSNHPQDMNDYLNTIYAGEV